MFISILTGVIVGLLSSQIARSALPPIDMINDSFVENPWIEVGYIDLDDQNWVEVSTNSSTFEDAVVFISLPFTEDVNHSLPLTARVRDVRNNNGIISFETRLYQPNDSFCSKEWKIPTPVSPPLPIAWSVVEKGAYNISNEFFMIGSGNITRPSSDVAARENHIRFLYPSGCEASNVTCRFPSGSTVGAITQLQTVVNDRFLFARGFNVALFFARFILESHESTDPNYSVLTDPETLAYMSYRPSVAISCVEGMGLETAVLDGITDSPVYFTYHLSYFYEPGLFGMVLSLQGQNPVVLRSFSSTLTDVGMVTEEDQCADEETQHTSDEKVGIIIMGEVTGTDGLVECKVKINQVAPHPSTAPSSVPSSVPSTSTPTTLHPTSAPSALPTTLPSGDPTLLPTGCPTVPPSGMPSNAPSGKPSNYPTTTPSCAPSSTPSGLPSSLPTSIPTHAPSWIPSSHPSTAPSSLPSCIPSSQPSASPSVVPTGIPTTSPSFMPSGHPTSGPTSQPTDYPSSSPSSVPTVMPTTVPTGNPTALPTVQPTGEPTSNPSSCPTALPSCQPTAQPTSTPTSQPSSQPTGAPSLVPTSLPSSYPTSIPSSEPTAEPTSTPTSHPSSQPSSQPTGAPSLVPTSLPSSYPTSIPSSEPTGAPSFVPTSLPSSYPTSIPSSEPTGAPSFVPTSLPSSYPTSIPSCQPTAEPTSTPTSQPTGAPSLVPTSLPSSYPTSIPSSEPTAEPTSIPTSHPSSQPSSQPTGAPSLVPTSLPSSYPTSIPSSEPTAEPTSIPTSHPSSQPSSQPTGAPSLVPTSLPSSYPTSIPSSEPTSLPSIHPSNLPTTVPISSPSSIPSPMPSFVPTELPSASPSSCPSQHPFASPTALPSAEPTAGPTSLPSMSPTQFTVWPKYTQSCTVKERSIDVVYSLSARGNIYCAAFEGAELPNLLTTRSISAAEGSTSRTHLFPTSNDTLILSGLKGSTDYKVLCYTEDFINFPGIYTATDLPVVYEKVCAVTTDCCKTVEASITQSSLISGEVSEQIIVQLSSPPSVSVTIIPRMYWGSHDMFGTECIPPADVSVLQLLPNSSGRVTPPALNFTDTVRSTTGMFFISSNASPGCLFFTAEIEGPSSSEYALHIDAPHTLHLGGLSTPSDGNNAAVLSISYATSIPPAPIVGSVYFDATGSNIIVEYNHETDAGVVHGLSNSFPCSEFTSLQLSSTSTCAFTSPRHVRITLAYGDSLLPLVGDNITFLGGKVIARCRMSTDFCMSNYPTERPAVVEISSNFLVQSSDVNVIVLGSHFVSDCHPGLQMDISSSSGSGGRPWSNISWAVYDPSNTRNYVLEDYMQSLAWVNCTPGSVTCNFLPTNIFTAAGIHTFVLYLENYLGHSGYGSFSFEYIPNTNATYVSPVVVSTGSVKGVSYSSLSHTAQAWARYNAVNSCNFTASGLDILYRWEVYINAAAEKSPDIAKLNIASDPRKFIVGSYNLSVGNEYIFRSFASSGPVGNLLNSESAVQSPISESRVYIRQGGLKARITGGSYQSASMASDLIVDASQSYDQDVTGRYGRDAGLYFSWRCVLLSSDMVYECPGFQKVASHDETLRIPSSYLNVSTLAFLVSVTDQAAERRTFAVTVINVVESLPIYVALSFDAGKEQTSNGRFVLDAVVSSPNESYTAFWGITRGNVVHSELEFPLGGSNLISSRFYSSLLSNGAMYTIQLGVTSYPNCDANCFEGVYEISVAINSPPSGGRLDVYPTYEESVYTLWASWWVDDDGDLPLYYTYVQSRKCSKDAVGILQQRSLRTWGVAKVGTGCPASNFSTEVGVIVSDVYGANSSASQTLNIFPQSNTLRNYRMGIQSGTNHYDIDRILQEINSLIGESLDCVDSEEYIEKCLNVTELTAGASSFIVDYIVPDYDTMATLVEEFQFRVEVMKMQSAYWVDRQLLTVDQVQRTVQYTSDLVSVVSSIPVEEMSEYYPLTDLAVAIDKLHQLVDTLPVNETSSSRRLQNGADATLSLRTAMLSLTQIIYSTLITGEQYSLSMGYYDFHTLSVWPSLVSDVVPVSSEDYISTSNIVDGESLDSISLGIAAVKINNGYDSQCNEVNTTCSSESPTLLTAVYVTTNSVNPSYNRTVYTLKNDIKDIDLPDNNVTTEITEFCDNQLNVVMDCSNDTAHGFPYIANFSCSDPFGVWELTCPQYDTTVMCLSSEREECSVEQFTAGFTTCVCDSAPQPAQGRFSSGRNLPTVTGFKTYFTESSNLAVYETIISKDPVAKYTSSPPTSAPSFPQVAKETDVQRPVTSRFPLIIPLLVLFCCCLFCCLLFFCAKPKDDVWMKINNSHPCLRHPVHIYGVGNTFTDIDDDMLLKIYDRAQPIWLDDFDELVGHYSTDSGTNSDTEECHDAGQYYRSGSPSDGVIEEIYRRALPNFSASFSSVHPPSTESADGISSANAPIRELERSISRRISVTEEFNL